MKILKNRKIKKIEKIFKIIFSKKIIYNHTFFEIIINLQTITKLK